jgi:RHS repeat-associated protein
MVSTQSGNGTATTTYGYDHAGERVLKTEGGVTTAYPNKLYNASTTKHIIMRSTTGTVYWDDMQLIAAGSGGTGSTTVRYVHTDHLTGSNVVTDSSGVLVETLDYYPYGSIRLDTKVGNYGGERRKFAGTEYDTSTGLNQMGARYYAGGKGRFLSEDPVFLSVGSPELKQKTGLELQKYLENPQTHNSYSYTANNPLKYIDKEGEWLDTVVDLAAIAYSSYKLSQAVINGGDVRGEAGNLALDVGSAIIPGVAGLGTLRRAANAGENVADTRKSLSSSVNLTSKQIKEISSTIARGHAYEKHIGEFKNLGIETQKDFQSHISRIIQNPSEVRQLKDGRSAYWDTKTATNQLPPA